MFAEMRKNIILKDYPELAAKNIGAIYLVDAANAVLGPMSERAQKYSLKTLEKMGVIVKLGVGVKDSTNDSVLLSDGTVISTVNLIWTVGVTGKTFEGLTKEIYGRGRRMQADAYNKVNGTKNIFALAIPAY